MKFISLFAGIGGFDLGLERASMECVGQVEINPFCQKVLAKHWPNVKRVGDIRDVNNETFGAIDLICGGFPCQPFSHAGKRRGKEDDRYLWPEMLRVIEIYKPAWIIGENVAGIISMALDDVLASLEAIGYQVQAFIIPACAVNAPHRRNRVWIIGHSNGWRCAESTLANANGTGLQRSENGREFNCLRKKQEEQSFGLLRTTWKMFPTQPALYRRNDGVSNRMDRVKALGNAVVPQVVEEIGKAIKAAQINFRGGKNGRLKSVFCNRR